MFSIPNSRSLATALIGAALASAVLVPAASADQGYQDLRSPDAVDAARDAVVPPGPQPCTFCPSSADDQTEFRTPPDARDRQQRYDPPYEPQPVADQPSEPTGFDWVSAAIGAAAAAGLSLVLLATVGIRRRVVA